MPILAEGVQKHLELRRARLPPDERLHVVEGPDRLPRHPRRHVPPHQHRERPRRGPHIAAAAAAAAHLDDELPRDVELAHAAEDVDHGVVRGGAEEGLGAAIATVVVDVVADGDEEGEGDLGGVAEAEEGLDDEGGGEGGAAAEGDELERGLERVEGVVVPEEERRERVGAGGGLDPGEARLRKP